MQPFERYQELRDYVGWTSEDAARMGCIQSLLRPHFPALIDDFCEEIRRHPEASRVLTGGSAQQARMEEQLLLWLGELFSGVYDREYVQRRWRVGLRHVDLGLNQIYTSASMARLRRGLQRALQQSWTGSMCDLLASLESLHSLLDLDLAIIQDAYQTEYLRRESSVQRLVTIGKVAGGIAHELRGPLNVIKTSVYFLREVSEASVPKRQSHLERIDRQLDVAAKVITALNDLARLPQPCMQDFQMEHCLTEAIELNPLSPSISLVWDFPDNGLTVQGARAQIDIVFGNLIRNAADAMPDGGRLELIGRYQEGVATILVRDSGKGITDDALPNIFEPLYTTKTKGIGLGLSIARDILTHHGGTISVVSQPNLGTTFTVCLPLTGQVLDVPSKVDAI